MVWQRVMTTATRGYQALAAAEQARAAVPSREPHPLAYAMRLAEAHMATDDRRAAAAAIQKAYATADRLGAQPLA